MPVHDEAELNEYMTLFSNNDDVMGYEDFRAMMVYQTHAKVQSKRYYVALSLEEAETIRGIIHSKDLASIFGHSNTAIGLRVGSTLLDSTRGFLTAPHSQQISAEVVYRFMNSDMYYTEEEIGHLIRALQDTPIERREAYFQELRSCRRRKKKEWQSTPLAAVFAQPDHYALLDFRAVISAVRALIKAKGMRLLDAFRAFDYNRDGRLSCSELYGGLEWLGMTVKEEDIYAIVRHVDKSGLGWVFWEHFEMCFREPADESDDAQLNATLARLQKEREARVEAITSTLLDGDNDFKRAQILAKEDERIVRGRREGRRAADRGDFAASVLPKL